jgi:hypothetical protein
MARWIAIPAHHVSAASAFADLAADQQPLSAGILHELVFEDGQIRFRTPRLMDALESWLCAGTLVLDWLPADIVALGYFLV